MGASGAFGNRTATQRFDGVDPVSVTATITGLTPATTYHFRITASNAGGTTNGLSTVFITTLEPTPTRSHSVGGSATTSFWRTQFVIELRRSLFRLQKSGILQPQISMPIRLLRDVFPTVSEARMSALVMPTPRKPVMHSRSSRRPIPFPWCAGATARS